MTLPVVADSAAPDVFVGQKRIRSDRAFCVDPALLRSLDSILANAGGARSYVVTCQDGTEWSCRDVAELLAALERPNRVAVRLSAATNLRQVPAIRVLLEPADFRYPVECDVIATERDLYFFSQAIESWIADAGVWYSRASPLKWRSIVALALSVAANVLASALGVPGDPWLRLTLGFGVGWLLAHASLWLFPPGTFSVGAGAAKAKRLNEIRRTLIVTVLLSGFLVPLIRNLLGG